MILLAKRRSYELRRLHIFSQPTQYVSCCFQSDLPMMLR